MEGFEIPSAHAATARRSSVAIAVLALCCLLWGFSFPVMKLAIAAFESHVLPQTGAGDAGSLPLATTLAITATFNGWRFILAAVFYWVLTHTRQRGFTAHELRGGMLIGLCVTGGMIAQISGLRFTLPSTSGFLTALAVVFAPLAQAFVFRRPVSRRTWMAVAIACAGIAILSQPNTGADTQTLPAATPPVAFFGEGLTILAALFFTGHILTVEHYGRTGDAARLTLLMFVVMGFLSIALGAVLDGGAIYTRPVIAGVLTDTTMLWSLASLIVFCSAAAMHLMNSYQPLISAAQATVVYCLEPLFATLFSRLFGLEQLTATTLAGGTVILLAVLLIARQQAVESRQQSV